jgi:GAF domain-containing protein/CheY-like chemotaxis protein
MKLTSSLSKGIFYMKRFLLPIFLTIAIPFFLFLVSGFLIYPHYPEKVRIFPLLVFGATALGLTILLNRKIVSFLRLLFKKIKEIHPMSLTEKEVEAELVLLNRYLDKINECLKEKDKEISKVKSRAIALNAIAAAMNQTLDVDRILNEVLEIILEVMGFDGGIMFWRDEENKTLQMRAWKGLQLDNMWESDQVKLGDTPISLFTSGGVVVEAVKRKQIIFVPDIEEDQHWCERYGTGQWQIKDLTRQGVKTLLVAPFVAKGKVFGAVMVVSLKPREPSLEENEFLETIGQQVGMALDNINLLSEWTKKARDLSLLLETSSAFSTSLSLNQILDVLTQRMMKTLDTEHCWTALLDHETKNIVFETFSSSQKKSPHIEKGKSVRIEDLPFHRKVVQTGRIIRIKKEDQSASAEEKILPWGKGDEAILLPLTIGNRVLGVVGAGLKDSEKLKLETVNLCRHITSQAAFAIENARLYEEVKQKAEEASSLYQVAQRLSSILDTDELLDQILKVVVESFGYLNCAILLLDKKKKELFVKAASGFSDELVKSTRIKVGREGVTGWVAQTGEPLLVGDVSKDHRYIMGIKECKSEVAVPLKLKGEVVGVLVAESQRLFAFGEKDVRILSQLASQIAVVLENSRLFSEEKKRYLQLALINDVGRKVVSTLNLDQLLESAIEVIQLSFKYDHISLFLVDKSSGELTLKNCCGKSGHAVKPGYRQKKGVGMVGRAAESAKTILCNDVTREPTYVPAITETMSELSVPIKSGKEVMGVLDVENFTPDTFDQQDVAVLETVTDLLATANNNARLYEETKRKAHRLELTDQINRAISSTLDLESVFLIVSTELHQIMPYDRISLNFWHPQEHLFKVEMTSCPKQNLSLKDKRSIPADETTMFEVVRNKKPLYQQKLTLHKNSKPTDRLIFSLGIRSYVLIPIINNQEVIAVLSLESKKDHGFEGERMELLNSMGSHLSVAIQNSKLFTELEGAYQDLKNTQSHIIQMERFRALGEMASGVVHDFNNILASILGRVQLLLLKLKKESPSPSDRVINSLQLIEKSATDGAKILSRMREFTKGKPVTEFCATHLNQLVEDSLEMTKVYWSDEASLSGIKIEIKKELEAKSKVLGDATELREVLTNLILNAVDAMPHGGTLSLKTEEDEESVLLAVEDTGVGMTEEVKNKVFVPFFTTKGEEGTGLGLSLSHAIITRHRGEVKVESIPGVGSRFTIKLPRCDTMDRKQTTVEFEGESAHILVIEDEKNIREVLGEILSTAGHDVLQAANGEEGLDLFRKQKVDVVITDLGMTGLSGWEVADKIKAIDPLTPVILSTGWGVKHDQIEIHKKNVDRIIGKPFNMGQILNLVSELLAERKSLMVNV